MKKNIQDNTQKDKNKRRSENDQPGCKDKHKAPSDGAAVRKEPGVE